ncbi:hypothetical protein K3495_g11192 [Podosphaera aphanis]|nr:hypothetical protein K3495_g11192 [Podosphaera aphanis]
MIDDDSFNIIIQTLRERDIPYDSSALESTLTDPANQTALREWVEEYLTPETLLTKNEAVLYELLTETGEDESLAIGQDFAQVPELHDHEVLSAIERLRRSTVTLKKQNEAIRLQQSALSALVRNEKKSKQARAQAEKGQVRKWDAEKSSIAAAISELTQSLIYQTSDIELQLKTCENSLKQTVGGILLSDDKLLLSFQKLASEVDTSKPENENILVSVRELCARYIKYTVEGVRAKLDRIFLETLANSSDSQNIPATQEEVGQLQEDLESLYTEILPVAQMSAEQHYLDPVLRAVGTINCHEQRRASKAVEYIDNSLGFLIHRIETILERAREHQSYQIAVDTVIQKAKELSSHESPSLSTPAASQLAKGSSPPPHTDQIEPEHQLGRSLGVKFPELEASEEMYVETLEKILSERTARLETSATGLEATVESCILSHLLDSHITLSRLRDALLSHSTYHTIKLADPELVNAEDLLEKEISQARTTLEAINLKEPHETDPYRDDFVNRWSR